MKLPDSVKDIRARYIGKFPIPQGPMGEEFEETARQWSIAFAEQVNFELPGQGWGMKRADPNRPISKDTIALQANGRLLIWDLLNGTGTGRPQLSPDPDSEDVTGQFFVGYAGVNHLGVPAAGGGGATGGQASGTASVDLGPVLAALGVMGEALTAIRTDQAAQAGQIATMAAQLDALATRDVLTDVEGHAFGATIVLHGRFGPQPPPQPPKK